MARVDRVIGHFGKYDELLEELIQKLPTDGVKNNIVKDRYIKKLCKLRSEAEILIQELRRYGCRRSVDRGNN